MPAGEGDVGASCLLFSAAGASFHLLQLYRGGRNGSVCLVITDGLNGNIFVGPGAFFCGEINKSSDNVSVAFAFGKGCVRGTVDFGFN